MNEEVRLNISLLRSMLTVIATEEDMRKSIPSDSYDKWWEEHWPFVTSMYLLVMVSIWHYIERELVRMAARVGDPASTIPTDEYNNAATTMADPKGRWNRLEVSLRPKDYPDWSAVNALRLLSNCYKHDPFNKPQRGLLNALDLHHPAERYAP